MDEKAILCHYSVNSDRRKVTFRLAPSSLISTAGDKPLSTGSGAADQPFNVDLEGGDSITDFVEDLGSRDRSPCCHNWFFKMVCSRFCIFLLIVKIFLLGVILPVHLQHVDYHNQVDYATDDNPVLHGYPNSADSRNGGDNDVPPYGYNGQNNHDNHNYDGQSTTLGVDGTQVVSPPPAESEGTAVTEPTHGENSGGTDGDHIVVVQHVDEPGSDSGNDAAHTAHATDIQTEKERRAETETAPPSCQTGSVISYDQLLEKIDGLMTAIKNIDQSIDKMEVLMQSTVVDERIYKCIAAITTGNQTLAIKYWDQILRYQDTPTKKSTILTQLVKESYSGKEQNIYSVIKFIDLTQQYYGYSILHKEMINYNQIFDNRGIFTLAQFIKKDCGRNSALFKTLPSAVQSVFSDFFTLQSKFNKGYLYYAKRCFAKHYFYCLDVLTKRIGLEELEALEAEEKRRYQWKLNTTDETVSKFFLLNQDKYWSYRLQDVNNSPRFKMQESGNLYEIESAHFQLMLHSNDEIAIQVRDSNTYLEGEEFKFDNTTEILLHSFHKTEQTSESDKIYWLVKPVNGVDHKDEVEEIEHENCKIDTEG